MRLRPVWLSAALLLAGCASMAPPYERPAAPVATSFPDIAAAGAPSAVPAADIGWQQFFVDARLKTLIDIALHNNRDLRVAALNIEQVRALYQVQRANQFPTVNLGAAVQAQPGLTPNGNTLYTLGLAVTGYELDFFGRVRSLSDAALQQYFATKEARDAAQISLVATVANVYLALLADELQIEVTRQTLATRQQSYDLVKLRYDNGVASEFDFAQAASLLEGARAALPVVLRQQALNRNALVLLLGAPLPDDLPQGLSLDTQGLLATVPAGLPSQLLERRPDVRQAEHQLMAANASIGAARANFFPRITLTGSAGLASTELNDLFFNTAWTFAPQITLPIFDAGRNQATLEASEANRDIAVAQYQRSIQSAFREVADALAGRATFDSQVQALRAQVQAEETRFRLADLRYRNGASSFLDVLDAQRALFQAQQLEIVARASQVQNLVTLYKVLGGGWTAQSPAQPSG